MSEGKTVLLKWIAFIIVVYILYAIVNHGRMNNRKEDLAALYFNKSAVIISMNSQAARTQNKFHTPIYIGCVLVQDLEDPEMHCELLTNGYPKIIDRRFMYRKKVGDKVFFKYIKKWRWFRIKNRKRQDENIK